MEPKSSDYPAPYWRSRKHISIAVVIAVVVVSGSFLGLGLEKQQTYNVIAVVMDITVNGKILQETSMQNFRTYSSGDFNIEVSVHNPFQSPMHLVYIQSQSSNYAIAFATGTPLPVVIPPGSSSSFVINVHFFVGDFAGYLNVAIFGTT
ncbi:MAG: hypothetical protein QW812_01560 [Thermoplasmataceae archaeon]